MKVNEPIIENIDIASEAYETAIEINRKQEKVLDNLIDGLHEYMNFQNGKGVIKGEDFVQGFMDKFDEDVDREQLLTRLSSSLNNFDEGKTYSIHELGEMIEQLDYNIEENRNNFIQNLGNLESFRWQIEDGYVPDSEHLPRDWNPSETYIGTDEENCVPDIELFQSTLLEDNLRETSITQHLAKLDETISYLEELLDYNQKVFTPETIEANEAFYEDFADFRFPLLDGLARSLRIAKNEKQGLEHFLIHNDEHDYLLNRWRTRLENNLSNSDWEVYGEEVDYFEEEPLTEKNLLPDELDATFWRDGEFDLLLKDDDKFAYVEIKSNENENSAERDATKQFMELNNYNSLIILNDAGYERIEPDEMKKFWTNQKPLFDIDYSRQIEEASEEITRLKGSGNVQTL